MDLLNQVWGYQHEGYEHTVEVYLLGNDGHIQAYAAPEGHIKLSLVDLTPIRRFIEGDTLPLLGTDPRNAKAHKIFSAAPIRIDGQVHGYFYVVLQGEALDALASAATASSVLRTSLCNPEV